MRLYVGTFTDGFMGGAPSEGLYAFEWDATRLEARPLQVLGSLFSPSYLCRHPSLPLLYVAERAWSADDTSTGALTTLAVDGVTGRVRCVDRQRSGGAFSAQLSVSGRGEFVALANPRGPTAALFQLGPDGIPRAPCRTVTHAGRGVLPRQAVPWPHSCYADPTGKRLLVCDLSLDRVFLYDVGPQGSLEPALQPFAQVSSAAGARHLAWHPGGRYFFVVNELDSTVSSFSYDAEAPRIACLQTVPSTPGAGLVASQPAEIVAAADGRFLYVTNRGENTIAQFAIDADRGRLELVASVSAQGHTPRHLALAPDATTAFVCNQLSGDVAVFAVNPADGRLAFTGVHITVPSASCLVMH